ncbi:venom protease-like isoform X2 [Ochlerotatus camptorhynchus]|uniref:venom protease-like isoform X2 n=1 Tax=Ochlerotatus camptorhynchus TaxID=644619 RepID=UPI0031D8B4A9
MARRCTPQVSAPAWMTVGGVLVVLLLVQLQPSSAVLKENEPCELNGSPGVCRPYAACRKDLQNKPIVICTHSFQGAIVCCPAELANRLVSPESERTAVRKCNEYRKLSYDQVTGIGLSLASIVARSKVPKCDRITKLIVGGNVTKPGEFPHMAAIGWREADRTASFYCGGSLISDQFVLTAAHCYKDMNGVWPSFVRLGDQNLFRDDDRARPKDYDITEFINHPQFLRKQGQYNDIALIKLDRVVTFSSFIRPACLYDREMVPSKKAIATGFGALGFAEDPSNELMKVSLNIYDNKLCTEAFAGHRTVKNGVLATQLCAGNVEGGYDTCQGDSGGPLQITDQGNHCVFYVFGITSIGQGCGANLPAIYTRVASFLSWIEPIVWN